MNPIKFRGRVLENHFADAGKMVFGYFVRGGNKKPYILADNPNNNGQSLYPVDEDSVAQLVAYDDDGNEVYEGDIVIQEYIHYYTREHVARLESMSQSLETNAYYFWAYPSGCTLKEKTP